MKASVELPNGQQMRILGFGMSPFEDRNALDAALAAGYRHFDTAFLYSNEDVLGSVLNRWINLGKITRAQVFIVTKIPNQGNHHQRAAQFLDNSLKKLQLSYVDLLLLHSPVSLEVDDDGESPRKDADGQCIPDLSTTLERVWGAMEAMVDAGKTKAIGVSNFIVAQMERIAKYARIPPATNQVELNAYYPKKALREYCKRQGIVVMAFAPLGSRGRISSSFYSAEQRRLLKIPPLLDSQVVAKVAEKHGKTPAQVLLRHLIQHLGVVVIPKATSPDRIQSNYQIFDFELDTEDIQKLAGLDSGKEGSIGFDWTLVYPGMDKHPEFEIPFDLD